MKRLKYAVILLLGLSMATMMTSCKKDNTQLIVGKWEATNDVYFNEFWGGIYTGNTFTFSAEGLTTFPYGIGFEYEVNGNSLFLIAGGDRIEFRIDELTSSRLKISWIDAYNNSQHVFKRIQ